MSERRWQEYIPAIPKFQTFLVKSMAPYLGVDYRQVSVPAVWDVAEGAARGGGNLSVFNGPTSQVFFKPWQKHLESQGVSIKVNSPVSNIRFNTDNLHEVYTIDTTYRAKWLVSALPVEEAARLISRQRFTRLSELSRQWMVAVQFYFGGRILKPEAATGIHLPESSWQLIIEPQGIIWQEKWIPLDQEEPKDIWSIGICDDQTPGLLIKKGARWCTQEEMWYQITLVKLPSYKALNEYQPFFGYLWYSFQWNSQETLTWEPKFSPNVGTWKLRPETDIFLNRKLLMAGVYAKNQEEIITMNAASWSGVKAALTLLKQDQEEKVR
jgi:uncharacterized protein with NAD-binding domain and iron-sulfur cluster